MLIGALSLSGAVGGETAEEAVPAQEAAIESKPSRAVEEADKGSLVQETLLDGVLDGD